jgi:hypothetical protein
MAPRAAAVVIALLATGLVAGCGDSDSPEARSPTAAAKQEASAPAKKGPVYHVEIAGSEFEGAERVGGIYWLKLGWRNIGANRLPMLAVTFSTTDGFITTHNRTGLSRSPAFATAEGPVWRLMPGYPRIAGTSGLAGTTSDGKTFKLGPLAPHKRRLTIWKLKALASGHFTLRHDVNGDLSENSETRSPFYGESPFGFYEVKIARGGPGA